MINPGSTWRKRFLLVFLVVSLCLGLNHALGYYETGGYEYNRARLLAYTLSQYLSMHHVTHKNIDDDLSSASLTIYLKQLDSQKLFLLKRDVEKIKTYSKQIDDELKSGQMELPDLGWKILSRRTVQVNEMVKEILSKDFDFSPEESIETDPEKLDYCTSVDELKERWRKNLKSQVLSQYLTIVEEKTQSAEKAADLSEKKSTEQEDPQVSARKKILKNYELSFSRVAQEKEREHYDRYFSAVTRAFDPHTEYMPPTNKEDFDISMRGSLEGIGATLREDDGYIRVVSIVQGGPASRQGQLQADDIILKVAEGSKEPVDLMYMKVSEAVGLIRGKKGTEVRLSVKKPDGTRLVIPITRDIVQLQETFAKGTVLKDENGQTNIGYIKIPSFYRDFEKTRHGGKGRNVTDDVKDEIEKLKSQDITGLILDLRNNGGGALTDAVSIAGLFIDSGPVVQVKGGSSNINVLSDDDSGVLYSGPVIVMVNQFSASASEILAGALQDYGRAVVIGGEHTHGKGTVQSIFDLNETIPFENMDKYKPLGALRLTIQKFYRITGESTQYRGIIPDIVLPDRLNIMKSGEQYLEFALPWDTVGPTKYNKWRESKIDLPELKSRSAKRVQTQQGFIDIEVRIKKGLEQQKNTLQSLNIDVVRKEREEARLNREKEVKGFHGHVPVEHKSSGPPPTSEEKKEFWIKEVSSDMYVREAIAVLIDMTSSAPRLTGN